MTKLWFYLDRDKGFEYIYNGINGNLEKSRLIWKVKVNVGRKDEPTPLPVKCGKKYWKIVKIIDDDADFPPYFLELDIPYNGPLNYFENGEKKIWHTTGAFGLHNKKVQNRLRISDGCIRHTTKEIIYIAKLLKSSDQKSFRYYIY